MLRRLVAVTTLAAATSYALAAIEPVVTLEDLGPNGSSAYPVNDANTPTLIGFDIHFQLFQLDPNDTDTNGDGWDTFLAALVQGTIVDPGTSYVHGHGPTSTPTATDKAFGGTGGRGTFVNLPSADQSVRSFSGAPRMGFMYNADFALIDQQTQSIDLQFFDSPGSPSTSDQGGGWSIRVVMQTAIDPTLVFAALDSNMPSGATLIASGIIQIGTENFLPSTQEHTWAIWAIPEPGSLALLVLGGLVAFRRR